MTAIERIIAYGALAVLLIIGVPWYFEHRGAVECKADDKAAVTKQEAVVTAQEASATIELTKEDETYHAALAAPAMLSPAIECVRVPNRRAVLPATPTASRPDAPADLPKADSGSFDPTLKLTPIGRDADARVIALQAYIAKVCLVR